MPKSPSSQLWPQGGWKGWPEESFKVSRGLPFPAVCQAEAAERLKLNFSWVWPAAGFFYSSLLVFDPTIS